MKIGIFDSGFGGIITLRDIVRFMPEYDYIYLGDNARAPYGDRSQDRIYEFTKQGVEFLFAQDCTLIILACNTASAQALRRLQREWLPSNYPDRRILGIIIPIVEAVAKADLHRQSIGLIGTRATIQSKTYLKEIEKHCDTLPPIQQQACPLLVPFIEEGWEHTAPATMVLKKYLSPLKQKKVSTLILGCTHYPAIIKKIKRIMGKNVSIIDPGPIVARSLKDYLGRHAEIESTLSRTSTVRFYTTDVSDHIQSLAQKFLGDHNVTLEKVSLQK
jgi:glutamate racemase